MTLSLSHDSVTTWPADTGVRVGPDGRPRFLIVFAASCDGEDCQTSFKGLACAPVELRASVDSAAPVVARVALGDSIHVTRIDLHVVRPGIVVVKRPIIRPYEASVDDDHPMPRADTLRIATGDTVLLLRYAQLGWWVYWWKGKTRDGGQFWGVANDEEALGSSPTTRRRPWPARSRESAGGCSTTGSACWAGGRVDDGESLRSLYSIEHWEERCPAAGGAAR
ncbi:MAG: hypothetical protein HOQ11_02415 [Gemmatimonadaceae bacterium]|nr:hypothetical protein [Gemmatimonadaceae bacterium]NUQ93043.1 hypothetical protein [Gemmatimonadaceae bacterium]NUR18434.1 hypothetical protein [Gemmatimonadaceae bacterium]NUS96242.1 hypothetical protein [Gemmatimonadaceae bacterium]